MMCSYYFYNYENIASRTYADGGRRGRVEVGAMRPLQIRMNPLGMCKVSKTHIWSARWEMCDTLLHLNVSFVEPPWLVKKLIYIYTGCPRRKGPNFGRVFLRSNYTDITQNTYIQSSMVTEILAREVSNFNSYYSLIDYQIHIETGRNMWFL